MAEPALFRRFPALAGRIPHRPFLPAATSVARVDLPGGLALFVKRDDRSCPLHGGNKPRKLEFLIGEALARRTRRIVTSGGIGTNHGLATTILGRSAGLATTLVLVDQPVTEQVRRALRLFACYGAEVIHARSVPGAIVDLRRVPETVPEAVRHEAGYILDETPLATPAELANYDGILFGTPGRFSMMAAQMKQFLDQAGGLWARNALVGKIGGVFV